MKVVYLLTLDLDLSITSLNPSHYLLIGHKLINLCSRTGIHFHFTLYFDDPLLLPPYNYQITLNSMFDLFFPFRQAIRNRVFSIFCQPLMCVFYSWARDCGKDQISVSRSQVQIVNDFLGFLEVQNIADKMSDLNNCLSLQI